MENGTPSGNLARASQACPTNEGASESLQSCGDRLVKWAKTQDLLYPVEALDEKELISVGTSEHSVYLDTHTGRIIKVTHAGFYGEIPKQDGTRKNALPSEYLERMCLHNEVFHTDIELEGIIEDGGTSIILFQPDGLPRIIISQENILPVNPEKPSPSLSEITEYMEGLGFQHKPSWFYGWYREEDGLGVIDAKEDNFILTKNGIQPIDLQVARLT